MVIAGATVTLSDVDLTAPRVVRINDFGNYTFRDSTARQIYVVSVASNRYTFTQSSIVLNDMIAGADFEAEDK